MSKNVWLSLVLITVACFSTIIMVHSSHHRMQQRATLDRRPDTFMTNVNYYQYDDQGLLQSHLATPKVVHFPHKNTARFEKPRMMIYTEQHIPWYISADHGKSQQGVGQVYLWDHVVVHQPQEPNRAATTINTSRMTFYPQKSYAQTDQNVTITRPGSIVRAQGMTADFKQGIITLLSHSRGIYEPPKHPQKKNH